MILLFETQHGKTPILLIDYISSVVSPQHTSMFRFACWKCFNLKEEK